jgi:hypothetical protein
LPAFGLAPEIIRYQIGLLATMNPTDLAIEAIRSLRTTLHFAMMEAGTLAYTFRPISSSCSGFSIPFLRMIFKSTRPIGLLATMNPTDLAIEAIRSLRTTLHFAMMEAQNNILMVDIAFSHISVYK